MITCSIKDLETIHLKLQRIVMKVQPSSFEFSKKTTHQNIVSNISEYVSKLFEEFVSPKVKKLNESNIESQMYEQIEKDLQKQQNLNRLLIKKELEFKQYQKCIEEELRQEKTSAKKLQGKLDKFNERIVSKDMEILHLSNEKKMIAKEKKVKDFLTMDTLLNDKKLNQGLKAMSKEMSALKPTHSRRRSDDVCKRPSTGASKRRGSVSKR